MADVIKADPADTREDIPPDIRPDTRWLSYDELAEAIGIKRESVIRYVRRKRWPKRESNVGAEVRVAVPADILQDIRAKKAPQYPLVPSGPPAIPPDILPDIPPDTSLDVARLVSALEARASVQDEQLTRERERADRAELLRDRAEAATDHARRAVELEREGRAAERVMVAEERGRLLARVDQLTAERDIARSAAAAAPAIRPSILARIIKATRG